MERLSNGMNRVVRLTHWNDPIEEGYFPKLDNILANRVWPSRPPNSRLNVILKSNLLNNVYETSLLLHFIRLFLYSTGY